MALTEKRIAILAEEAFEDSEITEPKLESLCVLFPRAMCLE